MNKQCTLIRSKYEEDFGRILVRTGKGDLKKYFCHFSVSDRVFRVAEILK